MQNDNEIKRINNFLSMAGPLILELVSAILRALGSEVKKEGLGLDSAFLVKCGNGEIKFYVHNLLLEIATRDRDEEPLRFDERLSDFDYFVAKTGRIIQSKIDILGYLTSGKDLERALDDITARADKYERIRIWRIDQK